MLRLLSNSRLLGAVAFAVLALFAAELHARQVVAWKNLLPQGNPALKDPFARLTQDQRFDIETIIWARSLSDQERALDYNRQPLEDAERYENEFRKAGLDVEKLIEDRATYDAEIVRRQKQVNNKLDGSDVKIAGYLLPLEFSETGVQDFLLVPYVGACVHVPPPPANQMVLVKLAKKMIVKDLYTPVWVSGQIKTKQSSAALTLVDGSRDVTVGYHIDGAAAEAYTPK